MRLEQRGWHCLRGNGTGLSSACAEREKNCAEILPSIPSMTYRESGASVNDGQLNCLVRSQEDMPLSQLSRELATTMQEFTQHGCGRVESNRVSIVLRMLLRCCARGVRPFGVSLLAAGYDDEGPHLYQIDPSGSYWVPAAHKPTPTPRI